MSLAPNRTLLVALTKDLAVKWGQTKAAWPDAKSLEFERKYVQELLASVDKTADVIEQLDRLLTKVRNDCE